MRIFACSFLCLALLMGCADQASTTGLDSAGKGAGSKGSGTLQIAVIPKGTTHVFWKSVHAGAVKAAKDLGDVEILWKGPLLENDRDGQINVVQDFIANRVDGIVLAPLDKQALIGPVKDSKEAGIPVAIFDSALQDESAIVTYVATDNYKGGELAARHMAQVLGGKGNVILLRYNAGSESTEQREEGFLTTLNEQFPDVKVLSSDEYAGTTPEQSLDKATQILTNYKDRVDGIFAVCEPNANGVLIALKETQLSGKVKFIAFDSSEELIRAMSDGVCHGIVLQDPITMGYESVQAIVKSIRGESVQKRIGTGEFLATPENMKTPEMEKLLNPDRF
ncbi:ABC transporter substrate-binding protein [Schlesneria sp.]|uniref:ABC transporter substrate-binding protein n=1 Tax=Schlesneria sp. TaxID=2762018 RepID=UPI002EE281B7